MIIAEGKTKRITRTANDGEVILVNDANSLKEMRFGGPDQANLAFAIHAKATHSEIAGNLQTLGGLSPQADTLGQEQLLNQSLLVLLVQLVLHH